MGKTIEELRDEGLWKYRTLEDMAKDIEIKKEIYHNKNYIIENYRDEYQEIDLKQFYYLVFGREEDLKNSHLDLYSKEELILPFETHYSETRDEVQEEYKYNSLALTVKKTDDKKRSFKWVITKDLSELDNLIGQDFAITSPLTYVGKNRNANNSRMCYGIAIDLDYVNEWNMLQFLWHMENPNFKNWPKPNIVINSGTGLHIYYLFRKPFPLFEVKVDFLNKLKEKLTKRVWNELTSMDKNRQFQNIFQGYRVIGSKTKFGEVIKGYWNVTTDYYSVLELNEYLDKPFTKDELRYVSENDYEKKIPIEEAKELWPEWYEKRIAKGEEVTGYVKNRKIYDSWLKKCSSQFSVGHRYHVIYTLAITARKCGVSFDEVKKDAYSLQPEFDKKTIDEDNHFLMSDVDEALMAYHNNALIKTTNERMSKLSGIEIPKNKRNGLSRNEHMTLLNARNLMRHNMGQIKMGRRKGSSPAKEKIKKYLEMNKGETNKSKIAREAGVSGSSVMRYYNEIAEELGIIKKTHHDLLDEILKEYENVKVEEDMSDWDIFF